MKSLRISPVLLIVFAFVLIGGVLAVMNPGVQQRMFDIAAGKRAATVNTAVLADDAMRVAVCGSSAPLPSAARAKACIAVFAGGKFYVVDVGPESVENLVTWGIPLSEIGGVLLTHFHSDHIGDLGELNLQTWAAGRPSTLPVYGGPGVDRVVNGFNEAYRLDQGYRTAHHGDKVMPPPTWRMLCKLLERQLSAVATNEGTCQVAGAFGPIDACGSLGAQKIPKHKGPQQLTTRRDPSMLPSVLILVALDRSLAERPQPSDPPASHRREGSASLLECLCH